MDSKLREVTLITRSGNQMFAYLADGRIIQEHADGGRDYGEYPHRFAEDIFEADTLYSEDDEATMTEITELEQFIVWHKILGDVRA